MPKTITFAARPAQMTPPFTTAERSAIAAWARSNARFFVLVTALASFQPGRDGRGGVDMAAAASLLDKLDDLSAGGPRDGVPEATLLTTGGTLTLSDAELQIVKRAWLLYRENVEWARARDTQLVDQFLADVALPEPAPTP